ncbi:cytochrome c oxidase subunit 7A1, mitochondrial-like [Arctopsyche grandis]|uniref:cytochrome c oxidase subunit 7A1, mitochondrial-like n=1 Tax=Arctopsyche grandis TaxID=121162 RepID=UPI00406D9646
MYHRFCTVTGRLASAANVQAPLNPIRPVLLQTATPPSVIYDTSVKITPITVRCQSSSVKNPLPEHIRRKMEIFQADNDLPVHLKGGPKDVILANFTIGLALVGFVSTVYTGLTMAFRT